MGIVMHDEDTPRELLGKPFVPSVSKQDIVTLVSIDEIRSPCKGKTFVFSRSPHEHQARNHSGTLGDEAGKKIIIPPKRG